MRLTFFLLLSWLHVTFAIWWWFTNDVESNHDLRETVDVNKESTDVAAMFAPFEISVGEQKFLSEANHYLQNLPMLDQCNLLIINRLKTSCKNLSDQELSKLSVNLLNCQSAVEGRSLYKCTDSMELVECTQAMDSDTWNTYHIISNRARAICYSVRQAEFRMKTEKTVNHLASATLENVNMLKNLASGQKELQEATDDAINMITQKQDKLLATQDDFKDKQSHLGDVMNDNMHTLIREKQLIAHRHKQVEEYTQMINYQLASLVKEIKTQELYKKKSEKEILKSLDTVKLKADEVLEKLEFAFEDMDVYHENLEVKQNKTLQNLEEIQKTIAFMNDVLTKLYSSVHDQLPWLHEMLGGTMDKLSLVTLILGHTIYFVTAFLAVIFVNAPGVTRIMMLFCIPVNCMSAVQSYHHLTYMQLSWILILTIPVHFIIKRVIIIIRNISMQKIVAVPKCQEIYQNPPSLRRHSAVRDIADQLDNDYLLRHFDYDEVTNDSPVCTRKETNITNRHKVESPLSEDIFCTNNKAEFISDVTNESSFPPSVKENLDRIIEPINETTFSKTLATPKRKRRSFPMSPGLNTTLGGSVKCAAFTRSGMRCKNAALCTGQTCRVHTPQK